MKPNTKKPIRAWHFLANDGRFRFGDGRKPRVGVVYRAKGRGPLTVCKHGMHGCRTLVDTVLHHGAGSILCRVELSGDRILSEKTREICAGGRKILAKAEVSRVLHLFAVSCLKRALKNCGVTDPRVWNTVKVRQRWAEGKADDEEMDEAAAFWWGKGGRHASPTDYLVFVATSSPTACEERAPTVAMTASYAALRGINVQEALRKELRWQERKLRELLKKNHPELMKV